MRLASVARPSGTDLYVVSADGRLGSPTASLGVGMPGTLMELIDGGPRALRYLSALTAEVRDRGTEISALRLASAVPSPPKILAIGRNYRGHAQEEGVPLPPEPLLFAKLPSSVCGSGAEIAWDASVTDAVDYEAELAVVISRRARNVAVGDALDVVFGYTCANDVSARDLQTRDGQWTRAKGMDTFCPLGPWLVTADEIPDPQDLLIECLVDGELRQTARTSAMVFSVADLISYLSHQFTLEPGDVILTGTPDGVGAFREPPVYLRPGNDIVIRISGIGELRNRCRSPDARPS
jgi:2-keto-4-pentenoate hydratase/2-oxohepta-3-ene-1,7-dioic acid hydratase in catechol pathway